MVRKNAEFHFKVGLTPKIIRKETGKCCKWCKNLVGTYRYLDVPKDVYKRHQNCNCVVEYIPKKGIRQDVHTKRWKYEQNLDKIKKRIEKSKVIDYKPLNDGIIEKYQTKSDKVYTKLSEKEKEALREYTQGGYLDINSGLATGDKVYYEKELNKAIKQYYIDDDIITYRGTSEKYYKNKKVGDTFEGKVFYSTSVKYEQAEVFAEDIT